MYALMVNTRQSVTNILCDHAPNRPWAQAYIEQLLYPQDWFSFWRLNCRLASYHALVTGSQGYGQEDKVCWCLDIIR